MAEILQKKILIAVPEKCCIFIRILLMVVSTLPITDKSAMDQVMSWYLTHDKPSPEPMLTKMSDAIWHH